MDHTIWGDKLHSREDGQITGGYLHSGDDNTGKYYKRLNAMGPALWGGQSSCVMDGSM